MALSKLSVLNPVYSSLKWRQIILVLRVIIKLKSNKVIHAKSVGISIKSVPSSAIAVGTRSFARHWGPHGSWRKGSEVTQSWTQGLSCLTLQGLCGQVYLMHGCTCWWACCGFAACTGVCVMESSIRCLWCGSKKWLRVLFAEWQQCGILWKESRNKIIGAWDPWWVSSGRSSPLIYQLRPIRLRCRQ